MKRPIFIIAGTVIVFILVGVWVYILLFGTPKTGTFADFNFGNTTDGTVILNDGPTGTDNEPTVDVQSKQRLKQLTTRPTIGYQLVQKDASSTPNVYYAESGTGHIYSIDTESGEETRISSRTIPLSRKAVITSDGNFVMIQAQSGYKLETTLVNISSSSQSAITMKDNISDFSATKNNTFLYSVKNNDSLVVKHYYPISDKTETLFTVPFREATIIWGDTASETHYAYPHPTGQLEGFVYAFKGGVMSRIPIDGYGLSTYGNDSHVVYSKQVKGKYTSYGYQRDSGATVLLPFTVLPEKCVTSSFSETYVICGAADTEFDLNSPDDWYKGTVTYSDNIWQINTDRGDATLLLSPMQETGRTLDMVDVRMLGENFNIFFINKMDQTLWLFDQLAQ